MDGVIRDATFSTMNHTNHRKSTPHVPFYPQLTRYYEPGSKVKCPYCEAGWLVSQCNTEPWCCAEIAATDRIHCAYELQKRETGADCPSICVASVMAMIEKGLDVHQVNSQEEGWSPDKPMTGRGLSTGNSVQDYWDQLTPERKLPPTGSDMGDSTAKYIHEHGYTFFEPRHIMLRRRIRSALATCGRGIRDKRIREATEGELNEAHKLSLSDALAQQKKAYEEDENITITVTEDLSDQKTQLEKNKNDALEGQKTRLEKEKSDALSDQKTQLEKNRNDALEAQKTQLEKEKSDALSYQKTQLDKNRNDALEAQKTQLEKNKNDALEAQKTQLEKEKSDALEAAENAKTDVLNRAARLLQQTAVTALSASGVVDQYSRDKTELLVALEKERQQKRAFEQLYLNQRRLTGLSQFTGPPSRRQRLGP